MPEQHKSFALSFYVHVFSFRFASLRCDYCCCCSFQIISDPSAPPARFISLLFYLFRVKNYMLSLSHRRSCFHCCGCGCWGRCAKPQCGSRDVLWPVGWLLLSNSSSSTNSSNNQFHSHAGGRRCLQQQYITTLPRAKEWNVCLLNFGPINPNRPISMGSQYLWPITTLLPLHLCQ